MSLSQIKIARGFDDFFEYDLCGIDLIQYQSIVLILYEALQSSIVRASVPEAHLTHFLYNLRKMNGTKKSYKP
ncbi:MAG: hypothetical protein PUP90_32330 [Nostoc sp. S4]|nr:hypothetical protein [Nostoc sp. S4]